jgi:hypothetical protein
MWVLTLYGAARQRAHDVTLEQDEDDDNRRDRNHTGCRQVVQGYGVRIRLKVHEPDGDRVQGAVVEQDERYDKLGPARPRPVKRALPPS